MILVFENRLAEIRAALSEMESQLERDTLLQAAVQSKDPRDLDILLAFSGGTRATPLVEDDAWNDAKATWLELNHPEQYTAVDTVREAIALFLGNLEAAKRVIADACGMTITDGTLQSVNDGLKQALVPPVVPGA
jgi:hypothetical protein